MNRTEDEIVDLGRDTLVKERLDARGYRDRLISLAKRSRIANLLGQRVRSVPAFAEGNLLQSMKRQRLKGEESKTSKWEKSSKSATFNDHNLDRVDSMAALCVQSSVKEGKICSRVRSSKSTLFGGKHFKEQNRPIDCRRKIVSDKRKIRHLKEDKILIQAQRKIVSDEMVMQELKDGEIPLDFQREIEIVPDGKVDQDLEDGEIPTNSLGEILLEKRVDQESEDDEISSGFCENTLMYKRTFQDLEEGEIPCDFRGNTISDGNVVRDLEDGETTVDSQDQIVSSKEVVQDLEEGEIPIDSQTEIYSRNWVGKDWEVGEIMIDYQEGCLSDNASGQNVEDQEIPIGCRRQIVPDKVVAEEGMMQKGSWRQNLLDSVAPGDVEQTAASRMTENNPDEKMGDFCSNMKSEVEHLKSSDPLSSAGEATESQVGKTSETHSVSESQISVSKLQASDISVIQVSSGNATLEVLPSSAKSSIFGEVPNQPSKASNSFLKQKNFCGPPVKAVTIVLYSDSENEETEGNGQKNESGRYAEHQNDVSRSPNRCKDAKTDFLGRQDVTGNVGENGHEQRHSGAVEAQQQEVIIIDDLTESPCQTMATPVEAKASEEAIMSITGESKQPFPSTFRTSGSSFTKISSLGVHQVANNVQLPPPTIASSAGQSSSEIPASAEVCRTSSDVRQASSQEAQFEGGPLVEELVVDHEIFASDRLLPPLAFMHTCQSEMPVPDNRSTAQISDFRSSNTNTGSTSVHRPPDIPIPHETPLFSSDPLLIEMRKILKEDEQDFRRHEDLASHFRYECEKAINEILLKYNILLKNAEAALHQRRKERCEVLEKVCANNLLAQIMKLSISKSSDEASNLTSHMIQMFVQLNQQFADLRQEPFLATSVSAVEYLSQRLATLSAPTTISYPLIGQMGSFQNGEGGRGPPLPFGAHGLYSSTSNVPSDFPNASVMRSIPPGNQFFGLNSSLSSANLSTSNIGEPNQQMWNAY